MGNIVRHWRSQICRRILSSKHHYQYGDWLKSQDNETRQLYFGLSTGPGLIESLVEKIEIQPDRHEILVAKNCKEWLGTLHIAKISDSEVEFGIIVHKDYRGEGIGNTMLEEAIVWARNRGYTDLFMHCLGSKHTPKSSKLGDHCFRGWHQTTQCLSYFFTNKSDAIPRDVRLNN